jgi:hypothetical protein
MGMGVTGTITGPIPSQNVYSARSVDNSIPLLKYIIIRRDRGRVNSFEITFNEVA